MQSELEKNISKELDYGERFCLHTAKNIVCLHRFSYIIQLLPYSYVFLNKLESVCEAKLLRMKHICNLGFFRSGTSELEGASTRMSPVGSACGSQKNLNSNLIVEPQDKLSRATQQYLEVLKKNYMIWNFSH